MKKIILILFIGFLIKVATSLQCNCRLGNMNRIVKGNVASAHSIPWIVSLIDANNKHDCGGAIINENFVLTAGHCIFGLIRNVHVGLHDSIKIDNNKVHKIKGVFYQNFHRSDNYGDFALLELETPITFIPGEVEPACLNFVDQNFEGEILSAGWGNTERTWQDLTNQTFVHPPKDTTLLKYFFGTQYYDNCSPNNICVRATNNGDSLCHGDSGSPLMYTKNGLTSVIGMSSFVTFADENTKRIFCLGEANYTRLSLYKQYLDKLVGQYCVPYYHL